MHTLILYWPTIEIFFFFFWGGAYNAYFYAFYCSFLHIFQENLMICLDRLMSAVTWKTMAVLAIQLSLSSLQSVFVVVVSVFVFVMPPTRAEALCFWVVRPSGRPYGNLVNTKSQEPLGGLLSYLAQGCTMTSRWTDYILGEIRSKVKGQWTWSKYAIFTSLPRNLKNPWVDFHQTWYMGAPPGVDELIRFWARSAQHQRSMNLV